MLYQFTVYSSDATLLANISAVASYAYRVLRLGIIIAVADDYDMAEKIASICREFVVGYSAEPIATE